MSLFSIPGSTLRLLHVTLHFIVMSPWAPILYKFIKQLTHAREVWRKDIGTHIAPNPCIALIKSWSYKKSLWEGCDFWTGWPSAAHLTSLRFCKSRVLWGWLCVSAWAQNVWCEWRGVLSPCLFPRTAGSHTACSPHQTPVAQITSRLSVRLARAGPGRRMIP